MATFKEEFSNYSIVLYHLDTRDSWKGKLKQRFFKSFIHDVKNKMFDQITAIQGAKAKTV